MSASHYYYLTPGDLVIRIRAYKRPGPKATGTWIVEEYSREGWRQPAFPEVSWNRLFQARYLGRVKETKAGIL